MVDMSNLNPEQQAQLQEKLKNMNPKELEEFQKQQCIFCHIAEGKVESKKIYEDEKVIAVLDINPANLGHILLLPKEHFAIMPLMPDDLIKYISMVAKALSNALLKALKVDGTNIFIANGIAAGQKAQHFMLHIIPRNKNDNLPLTVPQRPANKSDLDKIKVILKKKINEIFGIEEEASKEKKKRKPKVVEAEFKEVKKKNTGKKEKKTPKKKQKKEEETNLDDIANLLGKM